MVIIFPDLVWHHGHFFMCNLYAAAVLEFVYHLIPSMLWIVLYFGAHLPDILAVLCLQFLLGILQKGPE